MKYLKLFLVIVFSVVLSVGCVIYIQSCAKSRNPVRSDSASSAEKIMPSNPGIPVPIDSARTVEPADTVRPPVLAKIGAAIGVAWPFGRWELFKDWTGWGGIKTEADTHVGADLYARDLNQINGLDNGINIYAGFAGTVVKVYKDCREGDKGCNGGYGNEAVIYDASRHVALRHAHLSFVAVYKGQPVGFSQYLGKTGNTGNSTGSHLHIVGYENIDHFYLDGTPVIPTSRDNTNYACIIYFYNW